MLKIYPAPAAIIFLSSTIAIAGVGCNSKPYLHQLSHTASVTNKSPSGTALVKKSAVATKLPSVTPNVQPSQFELALDKATAAYTISQSARSADDWRLVVSKWQEALALMKAVPTDSQQRAIAQKKITEYQQNIEYAQQQVNLNSTTTPQLESLPLNAVEPEVPEVLPPLEQDQTVIRIPVKRRESGTPVINVTFNGTQKFEMIVDTGASNTVITQAIATALGIKPTTTAKANTASDRGVEFLIGYVDTIEVGGVVVNNLPVAIAPSAQLETGLLGHDFFQNYDLTFKRDVIEFRPR
ncbi:hypothetical protein Glo7428_0438 [Gloeocapsa sp. PCC 7428]|uniref:retropepsin-like aspartic protease family protein n=1 Tax=Gloeocapsa sp. PCC 7428 TaxID=1173026 RepID=UPI0002A60707|nr:retropepsin-like aspartic protease [Gloeocapsa sp. PCC 7428]AFZ29039.1 hypothetical protein Glo7428_0438 [Gloeocapsa sp. PCC 7428]